MVTQKPHELQNLVRFQARAMGVRDAQQKSFMKTLQKFQVALTLKRLTAGKDRSGNKPSLKITKAW